MILVSGSSNPSLARSIANYLYQPLAKVNLREFRDQELFVEIEENVRGQEVFIIQSTSCPANRNVMQLLILIDAAKRASAKSVAAVIPYYGYARQDRKTSPRTAISAKLIANLVERAGADRVLTVDLHAGQIQGFFDIPTDNLYSSPLFASDIRKNYDLGNLTIVSPDIGGVARARALASRLNTPIAIVDKRRPKPGSAEVMNIVGEVKSRECILVDDIVDSAGTLSAASHRIMADGAKRVTAYCTHGVLSDGALDTIEKSALEELVITDSITLPEGSVLPDKIRYLSIAGLVGEAIRRISNAESVSGLFT